MHAFPPLCRQSGNCARRQRNDIVFHFLKFGCNYFHPNWTIAKNFRPFLVFIWFLTPHPTPQKDVCTKVRKTALYLLILRLSGDILWVWLLSLTVQQKSGICVIFCGVLHNSQHPTLLFSLKTQKYYYFQWHPKINHQSSIKHIQTQQKFVQKNHFQHRNPVLL